MIDLDVMQGCIREANPVPNLDDLDTDELARFVAAAHARRAATMQAPTQHPSQTTPTTRQAAKRRSRQIWAFAAAFIIVLLGVGAAALLLGGEEQPVVDEPSFDVESLVWTRVPLGEAASDLPGDSDDCDLGDHTWGVETPPIAHCESMNAVTPGGPGFVAVGGAGSSAAVWTSADGGTWDRIPHNQAIFGVEGRADPAYMFGVTEGGPGLVAVGGSGGRPVVWTSVDGTAWTKLSRTESGFMADVRGGGGPLLGIDNADAGLIAISGGAAWTSRDGITWTRSMNSTNLNGRNDVSTGGPGFVAVGWQEVWTSPDGFSWSPVPWDDAVFVYWPFGHMASVAEGGPGLVAVGNVAVFMPSDEVHLAVAVWTSVDGITWSRVIIDEDRWGKMNDVVAVGDGLVAVGYTEDGAAAWTSHDGVSWSPVTHDEAVFGLRGSEILSITAADEGIVAVGRDGDDAAVWIAAPED